MSVSRFSYLAVMGWVRSVISIRSGQSSPLTTRRRQGDRLCSLSYTVSTCVLSIGDIEIWRYGDMETWRHGDSETWRLGDMETCGYQTEDGKRKPRRFSIICLPFAHRANGSLSAVHWLMKKKTEDPLQTN